MGALPVLTWLLRISPLCSILGLAFPAISNLNKNPFFVNANADGAVDANQFGFYLASSGSELYLGGTNEDLYSESIEFNSVDSSGGFWQATGAKAKVGSTSAVTGFQTIIDSGTTLMYGPPAAVKKVFAKVTGSKLFDSTNGMFHSDSRHVFLMILRRLLLIPVRYASHHLLQLGWQGLDDFCGQPEPRTDRYRLQGLRRIACCARPWPRHGRLAPR
jgi:hypothetical protein